MGTADYQPRTPRHAARMGSVLLTVSLSGPDAQALGHLLHKHPDRVQTFELPVGTATVFYPESTAERVTAALLLEVDPIGMVKRRLKSRDGATLTDYVTDRPYAASSMLAVALGRVFNTALNGRSDSFPELAASPLPLQIRIPAVPVRPAGRDQLAGAALVRGLFEPLGWTVAAHTTPFGPDGSWGEAPYVDLTLTGSVRLADALSQVYVLLPVLDNAKHYWVGTDEVTKLVRRGEGWLADHPLRELIVRRYLVSRPDYVEDATLRLTALDDVPVDEPDDAADEEAPAPLKVQRLEAVLDVVHQVGARRVVDLGCGEGHYLRALLADPTITEVVGVDVSSRALARAERRLNLDRLSDHQRARITLRQSSVTYRDDQLAGFDAILLVEVVEHLEPDRIASLEAGVFGAARPGHVIVTTPNRDYNPVYGLADGDLRHPDHRFEWTRAEFAAWADGVASGYGYRVEFRPVGEVDPDAGPPTQLALFSREGP